MIKQFRLPVYQKTIGVYLEWERTDARFMFVGNRRYDAASLPLADITDDQIQR